jgi:hypothetical protein
MTVTSSINKVEAPGNGVATTFSFSPMAIFETTDIVVTIKTVATGVESAPLTEGVTSSDYSVQAVAGSYPSATGLVGQITYPASGGTPLAATHEMVIRRSLPFVQLTDLQNQSAYFPDVLEAQLDKLLMIDLQQEDRLDGAIHLNTTIPGVNTELDSVTPGGYIRFNAAGDGVEAATLTTTAFAGSNIPAPITPDPTLDSAGAGGDFSREDHVHLIQDLWHKGTDVASAATLSFPSDGNFFDVTGTTTITALPNEAEGRVVKLQFDAALTLTHNATSLILPNGASITTAAGDYAIFHQLDASGNWQCVSFIYDGAGAATAIRGAGEIIYGAITTGRQTRLAQGTDGQYLIQTAGVPAWVSQPYQYARPHLQRCGRNSHLPSPS